MLGRGAYRLGCGASGGHEAADVFAGGEAVGVGENRVGFRFGKERKGNAFADGAHDAMAQTSDAMRILGTAGPVPEHPARDDRDIAGPIIEVVPGACTIDLKTGFGTAYKDGNKAEVAMRGKEHAVGRRGRRRVVGGAQAMCAVQHDAVKTMRERTQTALHVVENAGHDHGQLEGEMPHGSDEISRVSANLCVRVVVEMGVPELPTVVGVLSGDALDAGRAEAGSRHAAMRVFGDRSGVAKDPVGFRTEGEDLLRADDAGNVQDAVGTEFLPSLGLCKVRVPHLISSAPVILS